MKLLVEESLDDKGTPIELANAILNLPMVADTDNLDAIVGHLRVEATRRRREEHKRQYQGCLCAQDE